jgi:hypothetical protein
MNAATPICFLQRDFLGMVEERVEGPQQPPEHDERERHGGAVAEQVVGGGGQLEHLQRPEDADQHEEGRRRGLQRGQELVVQGRLGSGGKFPQPPENQAGHQAAHQQGSHQKERGDDVVDDRVVRTPDIKELERGVHQMFQEVRRVLGEPSRGDDRGGLRGQICFPAWLPARRPPAKTPRRQR